MLLLVSVKQREKGANDHGVHREHRFDVFALLWRRGDLIMQPHVTYT